jgi:guanylate kinase
MFFLETLDTPSQEALQNLTKDFDPQKPTLLVYSGPSGVGKGVLRNALYTGHSDYGKGYKGVPWQQFQATVSATTRLARPCETEGVDYYFLNSERFNQKLKTGDFLEWKSSGSGDLYGTLKSEIDRIAQLGLLPVLEIETEGKKEIDKLKSTYNVLSLFILPPAHEDSTLKQELSAQVGIVLSEQPTLKHLLQALNTPELSAQLTTLYSRLNHRSTENKAKRFLRLTKAVEELKEAPHYDVVLVNDSLGEAVPKVQAVFEAVYNASYLHKH